MFKPPLTTERFIAIAIVVAVSFGTIMLHYALDGKPPESYPRWIAGEVNSVDANDCGEIVYTGPMDANVLIAYDCNDYTGDIESLELPTINSLVLVHDHSEITMNDDGNTVTVEYEGVEPGDVNTLILMLYKGIKYECTATKVRHVKVGGE